MINIKDKIRIARDIRETGDVDDALKMFLEIKTNDLDERQKLDYFGELGLTYFHLKEYDKAKSIYEEAEELSKSLEDESLRALALRHLSRPEFNLDDSERSLSLAKEARELACETGRADLVWFDHGVITSLIYNNASQEELISWFEIEAQDLYEISKNDKDELAKWVWVTGLLMDRAKIFKCKADLYLALTIAEKFELKRRIEQIEEAMKDFD